jgi:hypothetical protein
VLARLYDELAEIDATHESVRKGEGIEHYVRQITGETKRV